MIAKQEIISDYDLIADNVPGFKDQYTRKEFVETFLAVESRVLKNTKFGSYGVPIVDYFNHDEGKNVKVFYLEKQGRHGVNVIAKNDIAKGE